MRNKKVNYKLRHLFVDFSNCMQEQINRRRIVIEIEAFIVSYKRIDVKEKNSFGKDFL